MQKMHLAVSRTEGETHYTNTLCERSSDVYSSLTDDSNSVTTPSQVTCKLCLGIMKNPKHWAFRKWGLEKVVKQS